MAFDRKRAGSGPATFGNNGSAIDVSGGDYTVQDDVKAISVIATGDVVLRPRLGTEDITINDAPVGMLLPWHCLVIRQTGTTATLATVTD